MSAADQLDGDLELLQLMSLLDGASQGVGEGLEEYRVGGFLDEWADEHLFFIPKKMAAQTRRSPWSISMKSKGVVGSTYLLSFRRCFVSALV